MQADLEEGEIGDSDSSPPRQNDLGKADEPTPTVPVEPQMPALNPALSGAIYRGAPHKPCLDSSGSASSDSDEYDSDDSPQQSKIRRQAQDMAVDSSGQSHGDAFRLAAQNFQMVRANKVWTDVVFDQTMGDTMRKVNTAETVENQEDRGVESYDFSRRNLQPTESYEDDTFGNLYGDDNDDDDNSKDSITDKGKGLGSELAGGDEPELDIGDIESFGTGPETKSRKRTIKDRLGKRPRDKRTHSGSVKDRLGKAPLDSETSNSRSNSPTVMEHSDANHTGKEKKSSLKNRLGQQGPWHVHRNAQKATFDLRTTESDEPEKVAQDLVRVLGEPEFQLELFFRVTSVLGVKKSLDLYYETESIEEGGGMMILNGSRRRSPGGVFLHLVKTCEDLSAEDSKKIFLEGQQKNWKRNRKHKKKKNNKHAKDNATSDACKDCDSKETMDVGDAPVEEPQPEPLDDLENNPVDLDFEI